MKRTTYKICGRDVLGYRIGGYLAVRDKSLEILPGCKMDMKSCIEDGKWILEHLPTEKIIARGYYRADVLKLAETRPFGHIGAGVTSDFWLATKDLSLLVDQIKTLDPAWYEAIQAQQARVSKTPRKGYELPGEKRTIGGYEITGPTTQVSPGTFVARYTGPGRSWLRFARQSMRPGYWVNAYKTKKEAIDGK